MDTVGGYIVQALRRWPRAGDVVTLGRYRARVQTVLRRRVGQVLIMPATQEDARIDGPGSN